MKWSLVDQCLSINKYPGSKWVHLLNTYCWWLTALLLLLKCDYQEYVINKVAINMVLLIRSIVNSRKLVLNYVSSFLWFILRGKYLVALYLSHNSTTKIFKQFSVLFNVKANINDIFSLFSNFWNLDIVDIWHVLVLGVQHNELICVYITKW